MSPAILQMSMGIERRWVAKIVFIMGMYCAARSPLTLRMRMREVRGGGERLSAVVVVGGWELLVGVGEREAVYLLMWVRARVRAPAMAVVGLPGRMEAGVVARRWAREARRVSWMRRKGRYLFASSVGAEVGG